MHILFFGDSLTLGYGDEAQLGWPGRLCRAAMDRAGPLGLTAYNLGLRRNQVAQVRARWQEEAERRLMPGEPALLVFCLGAVDALHSLPEPHTVEEARLLLTEARDAAPCLLLSPPPVADPEGRARIASLARAFSGLAQGLHIPYLDVYHALAASDAYTASLATLDGIHPDGAGHDLLARLVEGWDAWNDALKLGLTRP